MNKPDRSQRTASALQFSACQSTATRIGIPTAQTRRQFIQAAFASAWTLAGAGAAARSGRVDNACFIDPSAKKAGAGTYDLPWNSFAPLADFQGDLDGLHICIRAGTKTLEQLYMRGASNFRIRPYGGSSRPVIDGSAVIRPADWRRGPDDTFFVESSAPNAIFVQGSRLAAVSEFSQVARSHKQYYDEDNGRLYVGLKHGADPSTLSTRITRLNRCVQIIDCTGFMVSGLAVWRADDAGVVCYALDRAVDDITIENCVARDCGGYGNVAADSFLLSGMSRTAPAKRVVLRGNQSYDALNCGFELNWLEDFIVENNLDKDSGTGIELYRSCRNGRIARNRLIGATAFPPDRRQLPPEMAKRGFGTGSEIWLAGSDVAADVGGHGKIRIEANLLSHSRGEGLLIASGTGHVVTNNTVFRCGGGTASVRVTRTGADPVQLRFTNNIVFTGPEQPYLLAVREAAGDSFLSNYNVFFGDGFLNWKYADRYCATLQAWQAASGQDRDSRAVDPGFVDAQREDFRIRRRGGAEGAGHASFAPVRGLDGFRFGDPPNCGAFAVSVDSPE